MTYPSAEIRGTSKIVIHAGRLDEFKRLAAQCVDIVRSQDDGTVEYDLFLDEQRMECFVHERYRDSAAGLQHMANIEPMMKPIPGLHHHRRGLRRTRTRTPAVA